MSELIGIREAARRMGVSDTAVHKAIKAGRVHIAGRTEKSARPLVAWPQVADDWRANSNQMARSHVGPTGTSPTRAKYAAETPEVDLPTSTADADAEPAERPAVAQPPAGLPAGGPSLAQSNAVKAAYQARLAKLDYEERSGRLIAIDEVKKQAFKMGRTIRDGLMNLPDRIAHELAAETDASRVHMRLSSEIRSVLTALSS